MATQRVAPDQRRRAPAIGTRHFLTVAAEMSCAPGPSGRVCKLAAPRGSAPGPGKERCRQSFPGLPPCQPPAVLRAAPRAASREPRAPGAAAAERYALSLRPERQTSPPALFTFLGGLQQLSLLCPQPILRGLPDAASQLRGPQRPPAVLAQLPAPCPPAGAAGETLKLNLEAQT